MRVRTNKMSIKENTAEDLFDLMIKENVDRIRDRIKQERQKELERYKKSKQYQKEYKRKKRQEAQKWS